MSANHFSMNNPNDSKKEEQQTRVIVPMMWGMIPFWHKVAISLNIFISSII